MAHRHPRPPVPQRTLALLWLLRLAAVVTASAVVTAPVLSLLFLLGADASPAVDTAIAVSVVTLTTVQAAVAVLAWRPGRLSGWAAGWATVLALVTPMFFALGAAGQTVAQVLLGPLVLGPAVGLWIWARHPDRARTSYRPPVPPRRRRSDSRPGADRGITLPTGS